MALAKKPPAEAGGHRVQSVVEDELGGVEQRPEHVLQGLLAIGGVEDGDQRLDPLPLRRHAAVAADEQFVDDLARRAALREPPLDEPSLPDSLAQAAAQI